MRLGLDARKYFDFGIGTYLQNILREFPSVDPDLGGVLYVSPTEQRLIDAGQGWQLVSVPFKKYSLSELTRFSSRAGRDHVDLFHEPHYTLPYFMNIPAVVTVHDLIHIRLPHLFTAVQVLYAKTVMRHAVKSARAIITLTEFDKQELSELYPRFRDKIFVIPLAAGGHFKPITDFPRVQSFRVKFGIDRNFLLYAGSLKPHKNIPILLEAFANSIARGSIDLVFAGENLSGNEVLSRRVDHLRIANSIHDVGRISATDLATAFACAEGVILPSEYEGFGLPLVEAMQSGTPAIISDAPALMEVAGGAALVVERQNVEQLSGAIDRLCADQGLRDQLRTMGLRRANQFSWRKTAEQTIALYRSLA